MLVTQPVEKAVIPAGGLGTRFLPITKSMPKEMLPIIDTPVIYYVVKEAVLSGLNDIIIVTGRGKRAIEDYFDDAPELEMFLKERKKFDLLKTVRDVSSIADIHYIRQKEPLGLGDAVLRTEKHISGEPFAVLLGDDLIRSTTPCIRQLIDVYRKNPCSIVSVEPVPREKVNRYGIIDGEKVAESMFLLRDIIEKPSVKTAPSNLAAIGRYLFNPEIFDCLHSVQRGVGGEFQLTDAIRMLIGLRDVYAYQFDGKRYDTGDKFGYVEAILDYALENPGLREKIIEYMGKVNVL